MNILSFASLFAVAAGGAVGAVLRYLLSTSVSSLWPDLPVGTLVVNALGSFAIGLLAGWWLFRGEFISLQTLFFRTGVLGGFTTFSAFSLDTLVLWQNGQMLGALLNIVVNVTLCLVLVSVGFLLVSALQR